MMLDAFVVMPNHVHGIVVLGADPGFGQEVAINGDATDDRDGVGKTVVVAMSGGVDSAVTALIMRERGYRVIGMNLRLFSLDDPEHSVNPCCGIPAMDDARATCQTEVSIRACSSVSVSWWVISSLGSNEPPTRPISTLAAPKEVVACTSTPCMASTQARPDMAPPAPQKSPIDQRKRPRGGAGVAVRPG